ncbi:hypothetical protein K402DRAFT_176946 [Aulographum hederae CBS 113979]|uniref:HMG box domain-containing protein n=1 Tax=Aulographum hederae CBS 113979 TaxID=1176131 RepID=A0A6G1GQQ8_9PEZI|nr:hypothetical protein K402DRAFT_176946 [Aulographum hederae CBS 113979]
MSQLGDVLARLGLEQYLPVLVANGFNTWPSVLDITEADFENLGFKLGHRRLLQREIASARGYPLNQRLRGEKSPGQSPNAPDSSAPESSQPTGMRDGFYPGDNERRTKRKYKRHPKADKEAPKRPKTAYVNFADHLRTDPSIASLGFVDIAREVGRRWQNLDPEDKQSWEREAAQAVEEYDIQMEAYKRTDAYKHHQKYLQDFKKTEASKAQQPDCPKPSAVPSRRMSEASSVASPSNGNTSESPLTSHKPSASSRSSESEDCQDALVMAMCELHEVRKDYANVKPYGPENMPSEDMIRHSTTALIQGTGSVLHLWAQDDMTALVDRVYHGEEEPDSLTLAEMFVSAAIGAHYDSNYIMEDTRRTLYTSGTIQFHEVAEDDYLRVMRILACLSFFSILEKHLSARQFAIAGLQVARWKYPQLVASFTTHSEVHKWMRIYRTLVFVDCWLSYTLGFTSSIQLEDVNFTCGPLENESPMEDVINLQATQVALVAAEISDNLVIGGRISSTTVAYLAEKLDRWHQNLPDCMHMAALSNEDAPMLNFFHRRAVLMVHVLYLGAITLLYREPLLLAEKRRQSLPSPVPVAQQGVLEYQQRCSMAAQQIARILGLISFDGVMTFRCWLTVYWAYTAATILLFMAAQKMLDRMIDGIDDDLLYAQACLEKLSAASPREHVAAKFASLVQPLYDGLLFLRQSKLQDDEDVHRSAYSYACSGDEASNELKAQTLAQQETNEQVYYQQTVGIAEKLAGLLKDPFGRTINASEGGRPDIPTSDASTSVFWWR